MVSTWGLMADRILIMSSVKIFASRFGLSWNTLHFYIACRVHKCCTKRSFCYLALLLGGCFRVFTQLESSKDIETLKLYKPQQNWQGLLDVIKRWGSNSKLRRSGKMFLVKHLPRVVKVSDTFAEMFPLWAGRVLITAQNEKWAQIAASITTSFATSVIAASAEAAVERTVQANETQTNALAFLSKYTTRSL